MTEPQTKTCKNCHQSFAITAEDFGFYEKMQVPPPTWCPQCRIRRRMMWRNEITLYRRKCDSCGKSIITAYDPSLPCVVYCQACWTSDKWAGEQYGVEYNWERPFFSQCKDLMVRVPLVLADAKGTNVNSEYCNYLGNCKNCYLCFSVAQSEDCSYCSSCQGLRQCLDSNRLRDSELCYGAIDAEKNSRCSFIQKSRECVDSNFIFGCSNATSCFMCANVRNQSYVFRGEQLDKQEYTRRMSAIDMGNFSVVEDLEKEFSQLKQGAIHRFAENKNSVDVEGDNITNSKGVRYSFDISDSENIHYSLRILKGCHDIHDCHGMVAGELVYEGFGCGFSPRKNIFSFSIDAGQELGYCAMCHDCSSCFACVGLRNKQYCILNKQYSKEEYEALIPRIKKHMDDMPYIDQKGREYKYGEFFPPELSPFAYNETIAQEYFPLTKDEALRQGFRWRDPDTKQYTITKTPDSLPDHIKDIDDSILQEVIGCSHAGACSHQCTTAFKIIPEELSFYRRMNLPLPRLCPNCRHYERLKQRNPLRLWHRQCMCDKTTHQHGATPCPNEFETSYAPDRKDIVYCEQCYQAEVV